jgi:hypothetical protein
LCLYSKSHEISDFEERLDENAYRREYREEKIIIILLMREYFESNITNLIEIIVCLYSWK